MNQKVIDGEFTEPRKETHLINASEVKDITSTEGKNLIRIMEAALKVGCHYQTIGGWEKKDKEPTKKILTDWNSNPVRVVDVDWLKRYLTKNGKVTDWIDNKDYKLVRPYKDEMTLEHPDKKRVPSLSGDEEFSSEEHTAYLIRILKEIGVKPASEPVTKKPFLILGTLTLIVIAASACGIIYLLMAQLNDSKSYREEMEAKNLQEIARSKKTQLASKSRHAETIKKLENNHKQQMMQQDKKLTIILEATKKLEESVTDFLPLFEEVFE